MTWVSGLIGDTGAGFSAGGLAGPALDGGGAAFWGSTGEKVSSEGCSSSVLSSSQRGLGMPWKGDFGSTGSDLRSSTTELSVFI
jgi:hypothetical protein